MLKNLGIFVLESIRERYCFFLIYFKQFEFQKMIGLGSTCFSFLHSFKIQLSLKMLKYVFQRRAQIIEHNWDVCHKYCAYLFHSQTKTWKLMKEGRVKGKTMRNKSWNWNWKISFVVLYFVIEKYHICILKGSYASHLNAFLLFWLSYFFLLLSYFKSHSFLESFPFACFWNIMEMLFLQFYENAEITDFWEFLL